MYCDKCGELLNENDAFCGNCGAKVELNQNEKIDIENVSEEQKKSAGIETEVIFNPYDSSNDLKEEKSKGNGLSFENFDEDKSEESSLENSKKENSAVKTVRINKKAAIICAAVLFVLIGGVTAFYFIWNNMPVEIYLNDYVSGKIYTDAVREEFYSAQGYEDYDIGYDEDYEESLYSNYGIGAGLNVYGYDGYASVSEYEYYNIIDWNSLEADVNDKLLRKKKIDGRHLSLYDFVSRDSFKFSTAVYDGLKNGDTVTISVDGFTASYGGLKIKFYGCNHDYEVSDLKTVQAFNPFEYVTLMLYGANGYANVGCVVDSELNSDIEGIEGFKVTYYDDTTIAVVKDDYIVAKIEFYLNDDTRRRDDIKNGDVVTMYCSCSEDLVGLYNIYIAHYQNDYNIDNLGEYVLKSSTISDDDIGAFKKYANEVINERYGDSDSYSDFKCNSIYIADLKDKTSSSSYHNSLCLIYSYVYTGWSGDTQTRYLYVNYENLILSPDGTIAFKPESYYTGSSNSYESVESILNSKFSDRHNISKIG